MISDWLRGAILMVGFLWGAVIGQCKKWYPDDWIRENFYRAQTGCWMSTLESKINQNFVWISWKLFNLDGKVIWSFSILIAKNKLDEKGTLSLISIGVPFLMNASFYDILHAQHHLMRSNQLTNCFKYLCIILSQEQRESRIEDRYMKGEEIWCLDIEAQKW